MQVTQAKHLASIWRFKMKKDEFSSKYNLSFALGYLFLLSTNVISMLLFLPSSSLCSGPVQRGCDPFFEDHRQR